MTEKREWWSDDLVEAVRSKIGIHQHGPIGEIRIYNPFDDEVYNVIAAVEDWARWEHVPKGTLRRLEQAEAAIARVRERAGGPIPAVHGDWMAGYAAAMRDILSALGHDIEMEGKR